MKYLKIKRLFRKYLAEKADDEERRLIEHWYDKLDKREPIQLSAAEEEQLEDAIWQRLEPMLSAPQRNTRRLYTYINVAASVAVLVFASVFYLKRSKTEGQKTADVSELFQDYYTAKGERKQLRLQDGSVIAMNSATHVRVYLDFSTSRRADLTDGEAFFEIQHDPVHPFIVRSGKLITHVLGTAFNIRAYKELREISIAVTDGKVQISDTLQALGIVGKQQKLVFNQQQATYDIQSFSEDVTGWKSGKLIIKNALFEDMALLMEKNYGITLLTARADLRKKKFTASLPLSLSAAKAAEVIASIHQLKIKQGRDTIELYR
ncbi:FecR family protein [Chitinophaga pinensis]|uniref:Anti-FecI sigma factor, FecR n=1 Tax=Chitinophaga pinensis (strain ATCC 43595 / DSM 2588 / LMG 13176 / NBRC 15968 / NCIMB 11800 / UQM 2034) TaxID=485918 RepID=A0A979G3D1_CHIPD|nr:FecR domain-containing protein [Chitinophaga pinensis]ACU59933.1 anti-FecI sigma factor, FecR [Chitinophaga pinensis DSM 2588]